MEFYSPKRTQTCFSKELWLCLLRCSCSCSVIALWDNNSHHLQWQYTTYRNTRLNLGHSLWFAVFLWSIYLLVRQDQTGVWDYLWCLLFLRSLVFDFQTVLWRNYTVSALINKGHTSTIPLIETVWSYDTISTFHLVLFPRGHFRKAKTLSVLLLKGEKAPCGMMYCMTESLPYTHILSN